MAANPTAKQGSDRKINHRAPKQTCGNGPLPPQRPAINPASPLHTHFCQQREAWASGGKSECPSHNGASAGALSPGTCICTYTQGDGICKPPGRSMKNSWGSMFTVGMRAQSAVPYPALSHWLLLNSPKGCFPGCSVVRTPSFHCRGLGSFLGRVSLQPFLSGGTRVSPCRPCHVQLSSLA